MKRILALALCLMTLCAPGIAETINGEDFESAQYIPAILETAQSYGYTVFEYAEDGALEYADSFWFGKAEDGSDISIETSDTGDCGYIANGVTLLWSAETGAAEAWAYTPDAYALLLDQLYSITMLYPDDEFTPFADENGAWVYAYDNGEIREVCTFDPETLRLIEYEYAENIGGEMRVLERITANVGTEPSMPEALRAALSGETRAVTVHFEDGTQAEYAIPYEIPMYLMDEDFITLSLDAEMTKPVSFFAPSFDAELWVFIGPEE